MDAPGEMIPDLIKRNPLSFGYSITTFILRPFSFPIRSGRFLTLPDDLERENKRARILSSPLQDFPDKLGGITNDARTLHEYFIRYVETCDLSLVEPVYSGNIAAANAAVALDNLFAEAFHKFEGTKPQFSIFFFVFSASAEPQAHSR